MTTVEQYGYMAGYLSKQAKDDYVDTWRKAKVDLPPEDSGLNEERRKAVAEAKPFFETPLPLDDKTTRNRARDRHYEMGRLFPHFQSKPADYPVGRTTKAYILDMERKNLLKQRPFFTE
jgi:hypothetical protein